MAVGFWPWAYGRGLLAVCLWPWAFGRELLVVNHSSFGKIVIHN